jgi:hypothetical protein
MKTLVQGWTIVGMLLNPREIPMVIVFTPASSTDTRNPSLANGSPAENPFDSAGGTVDSYRKNRLKAHGFNRGIKGGVARHHLLGMVRATNLLDNRTYELFSSHW